MSKGIDDTIIDHIVQYVTQKFGDNVIGIYGIGSSFMTDIESSDVDVVVILSSTDNCPKKDYTTALFEHHMHGDSDIWFLYGTLLDYLEKERFEKSSFANWEWSVRSLRNASKLLWGDDIRDKLPEPDYDYQDIFVRVAYHLEPTPEWKFRKAAERGQTINEKLRLTKSIFKFGFFLVAIDYPESNVFDKISIRNMLETSVDEGFISGDMLDFYDMALEYRRGADITDFENRRKEFMKLMVRETIAATENSWDGIRDILQEGFNYPFTGIINYIDEEGA